MFVHLHYELFDAYYVCAFVSLISLKPLFETNRIQLLPPLAFWYIIIMI